MNTFHYHHHTLAYRDEGNGPPVVLVHGTPSSSAEFAEVIDGLRANYRCIAPDLLGFGASDKPTDGDYSLPAHTRRLRALLDHAGVQRFHLVVSDFGGPIAFPLAVERWDAVESITLLNTWAWPLAETEPALQGQRKLLNSRVMRWLYLHANMSARLLVKSGWGSHRPLTREKHRRYQAAFPRAADRWGTYGFLRALVDGGNEAWQVHEKLATLPPKPSLILWGAADGLISLRTLDRWKSVLPHATVRVFDRVGHFVADEAPELVLENWGQRNRS